MVIIQSKLDFKMSKFKRKSFTTIKPEEDTGSENQDLRLQEFSGTHKIFNIFQKVFGMKMQTYNNLRMEHKMSVKYDDNHNYDFWGLSNDSQVYRTIFPIYGKIIFSDVVEKTNYKGKTQERLLVLTQRAILNLKAKSKSIRRAIHFSELKCFTCSTISPNFIIHTFAGYDYNLRCLNRNIFLELVQIVLVRFMQKEEVPVYFINFANLHNFTHTATKHKKRNQMRETLEKLNEKGEVDLKDVFQTVAHQTPTLSEVENTFDKLLEQLKVSGLLENEEQGKRLPIYHKWLLIQKHKANEKPISIQNPEELKTEELFDEIKKRTHILSSEQKKETIKALMKKLSITFDEKKPSLEPEKRKGDPAPQTSNKKPEELKSKKEEQKTVVEKKPTNISVKVSPPPPVPIINKKLPVVPKAPVLNKNTPSAPKIPFLSKTNANKKKMKKVFLTFLSADQVIGSVFELTKNSKVSKEISTLVDQQLLEKYFKIESKPVTAKKRTVKEETKKLAPKKNVLFSPRPVVIDPQVEQDLTILFKTIRMDPLEVVHKILGFDREFCNSERLENIFYSLSGVPYKHVKALKNMSLHKSQTKEGKLTKFYSEISFAENYIFAFFSTEKILEKIKFLINILFLEQNFVHLKESFSTCHRLLKPYSLSPSAKNLTPLDRFILVVTETVSFINQGPAQGFTLETLAKLKNTNSAVRGETLLKIILDMLRKTGFDFASLLDELKCFEEIKKQNVPNLFVQRKCLEEVKEEFAVAEKLESFGKIKNKIKGENKDKIKVLLELSKEFESVLQSFIVKSVGKKAFSAITVMKDFQSIIDVLTEFSIHVKSALI